jgi:hypothetical protein
MDSSVVVVDGTATRLDFFSLAGTYQRRVRIGTPGCGSAPARDLDSGNGHVFLLRVCTRTDGRTSALLERVGPTGERDVLLDSIYGDLSSGAFDPTRAPMLAAVQGEVYFSITPDRCTQEVGSARVSLTLCHPDDRPVLLADSARARLGALAPGFESLGAALLVPERYPPFEDIVEVGGRLAFHTIVDDQARVLDVAAGDELERFTLPTGARVFTGTRALLFAREDREGTSFAVVPLP